MTVIRRGDDQERDWWWARGDDQEGYVPRNLLGIAESVISCIRESNPIKSFKPLLKNTMNDFNKQSYDDMNGSIPSNTYLTVIRL
ncbi:unnamed protein product [Oppiella nova]|uniref:SH3 domain-containing protein n=1 Tax=Oppiella nova TaxID=334625 RepID=A0A7R9R335_9ACAR|nr:unnamed protein product [Oppiella nova]CAG2183961.1 unnamed protein product [Oppiella nova]